MKSIVGLNISGSHSSLNLRTMAAGAQGRTATSGWIGSQICLQNSQVRDKLLRDRGAQGQPSTIPGANVVDTWGRGTAGLEASPHRLGAQEADHSPPAWYTEAAHPKRSSPRGGESGGKTSPPRPLAPCRGRGENKPRPHRAAPLGNWHNTTRWPPRRRSPEGPRLGVARPARLSLPLRRR